MEKNLTDELFFIIMKFLREEKYEESLHNLEKEWGMFFNWKHFEDLVVVGNWDEVESYLSAFTKVDENRYSMKMFFDIKKQKYLEALDRHDRHGALDILTKDLKVFESYNEEIFKEITNLITLQNFRENNKLAGYSDTNSARGIVLGELKKLAVMNPSIRQKMEFPNIETSRLRTLLNQSLNWQHSQCPDPRRPPDVKTLLEDHLCRKDPLPQPSSSTQHTATNGPFKPIPVPHPIPLPTSENHPTVSAGGSGFGPLANPAAVSKHPGDSDVVLRPKLQSLPQRTVLLRSDSRKSMNAVVSSVDEVPRHVGRILVHGSIPTCLEFHPLKQTLLLVGTYVGEIILWEVSTREKIASREFQLWHGDFCSMPLKTTLMKDPTIIVKCVRWSPDGTLFGVAYSKHLIQLYTYPGGSDLRHHLEIDAHVGDVNDIAFCSPSKQLCVISCGDDKTIKVWDVATGANLYTFEGHAAPVYSVCPHYKDNVHFLLSTSTDGTIKAWLFDQDGARVDYVVPGRACSTMKYSSDGKRLFSCGTNKSGESQVVEWYEKEGIVKRTYIGCTNHSIGVIHFDITKNRFIAVGDDYVIKIWDIDNVNLLSTLDAEGGLQASPRIQFNKDGNLLAVTANDNKIKVLATMAGIRFMDSVESQSHMSLIEAETITKNGGTRNAKEVRPNLSEERTKGSRKLTTEINEVAQLRLLRLSAIIKTDKILRLLYTHSGNSILALASNGVHLIWKWTKHEHNLSGQATTKVAPQLMQPTSGMLMVNDLTNAKPSDALPCFALSKNDSYIMSSSGGKVSLFNMVTHKVLASFMSPPPTPTYLALHPKDNNIMAVGTEDGAIHIYNVPVDKVETKFKAHSKRITSLAFSVVLNALVSSGADGQIITWNLDNWEKTKSTSIRIPIGRVEMASSDVQVQFLLDQKHMLVVHETQLAIFDASELECLKQWMENDCMTPISHAVLSCDNQLVYASFLDGIVRVLTLPNFQLRCLVNPSAYLPEDSCYSVLPISVAANPLDPNQFAVGLTDGTVVVFEPPESDGKWVVVPRPTPADEVKLVSM